MIDPRLLRTYLAVCREGSISGAARRLAISQSAISVSMAQLERDLGGTLFERRRQGIILNPGGEALRLRAEAMENLLLDAATEVVALGEGCSGPLRVGGTPGALVSILPEAIRRLERRIGRLSVEVLERPETTLIEMLRGGAIEVAVVTTGLSPPPPDIVERTIDQDPFALVVGRAHNGLAASIKLSHLGDLGWVLPHAAGSFHRQVEALLIASGCALPTDVIRCDSLLASIAIVRDGARVTILPRRVVAAEIAAGYLRALAIADHHVVRQVGIRTMRARRLSTAASHLVTVLIDDP